MRTLYWFGWLLTAGLTCGGAAGCDARPYADSAANLAGPDAGTQPIESQWRNFAAACVVPPPPKPSDEIAIAANRSPSATAALAGPLCECTQRTYCYTTNDCSATYREAAQTSCGSRDFGTSSNCTTNCAAFCAQHCYVTAYCQTSENCPADTSAF